MSIHLSFQGNLFALKRLRLPTRYYHFRDEQNYIKLVSIGEGIFPKDKISTVVKLQNSDLLLATESATKVYPSKKEFGINRIDIQLQASNLEYINDELILYKGARFLQLLRIRADSESTFFYGDILSHGRSYEYFDFHTMAAKNSFYCDGRLEYLEKYTKSGAKVKRYTQQSFYKHSLFAKIYVKTQDNEAFLDHLEKKGFASFALSSHKDMIIGVISQNSMQTLKSQLLAVWELYRLALGKRKFNLGKE